MFCPKCGKANPEGARFCIKCGKEIVLPTASGSSSVNQNTTNNNVARSNQNTANNNVARSNQNIANNNVARSNQNTVNTNAVSTNHVATNNVKQSDVNQVITTINVERGSGGLAAIGLLIYVFAPFAEIFSKTWSLKEMSDEGESEADIWKFLLIMAGVLVVLEAVNLADKGTNLIRIIAITGCAIACYMKMHDFGEYIEDTYISEQKWGQVVGTILVILSIIGSVISAITVLIDICKNGDNVNIGNSN